jgi:hypothetical protein
MLCRAAARSCIALRCMCRAALHVGSCVALHYGSCMQIADLSMPEYTWSLCSRNGTSHAVLMILVL